MQAASHVAQASKDQAVVGVAFTSGLVRLQVITL